MTKLWLYVIAFFFLTKAPQRWSPHAGNSETFTDIKTEAQTDLARVPDLVYDKNRSWDPVQ